MADGKKITDIIPPKPSDDPNPNVTSQDSDEIKATASVISKHKASITNPVVEDEKKEINTTNINTDQPKEVSTSPSQKGVDVAPVSGQTSNVASNLSKEPKSEPQNMEGKEEPLTEPKDENNTTEDSKAEPKPDDEAKDVMESAEPIKPTEDNEPDTGTDLSARKRFEATDALPEANKEPTDSTQNPKIYDTKEYFVPIKDTKHSHGTLGVVLAGLISALIILGIVYYGSVNWF